MNKCIKILNLDCKFSTTRIVYYLTHAYSFVSQIIYSKTGLFQDTKCQLCVFFRDKHSTKTKQNLYISNSKGKSFWFHICDKYAVSVYFQTEKQNPKCLLKVSRGCQLDNYLLNLIHEMYTKKVLFTSSCKDFCLLSSNPMGRF